MQTISIFITLILALVLVACKPAPAAEPAGTGEVAVVSESKPTAHPIQSLIEFSGYTTSTRELILNDETRGEQVRYTLLYPATEAKRDAAPDLSGGPYPVLLYSHGGYLDGIDHRLAQQSLFRHLVSYGFVVASVDHNDQAKSPVLSDRPLDILAMINALDALAKGELAGLLNMERLGVMGMSLGTVTSLQMGGAHLDLAYTHAWCDEQPKGTSDLCISQQQREESEKRLSQVAKVDPNGLLFIPTDTRIQAMVLMSPVFSPFYGVRGLDTVNIPTMLLAPTESDYESDTLPIYNGLGTETKYLANFVGAYHRYPLSCPDSQSALVTAFFGYYLGGEQAYAGNLMEDYVNSLDGMSWGVYTKP